MLSQETRRIIEENSKYTDMLAEYDRTGHLPIEKVRRSFTLKRSTMTRLKAASKKTGKSMSGLIDALVEKDLKG
jgi:hypothetical protein